MPMLQQFNLYLPTVTLWNRLEGRPRTTRFDRALKAEVRDALWMLSKQWQMGEFIGDDAGSPVVAKGHIATTRLTKYQAGAGAAEPIEPEVPLEARVESRRIDFQSAGLAASLDIRLLMGRQWLKLVQPVGPGLKEAYVDRYGIAEPDPTSASDAGICAHSPVWQQFSAVATRRMDGYGLFQHLQSDPTHRAHDGIAEADSQAKRDAIDALAEKWVAWFVGLFYRATEENPSWKPEYLEHQFACSAPRGGGEKVLAAGEYHHGHLDWYNLDIDPSRTALEGDGAAAEDAEGSITRTFVPSSVTFGGMPHPRWWTFEDWKTNLGFVTPDTTDLNKLLLLDFFLLYSNDWFVLPVTLPVGSLTDVRGLMVTNVFGEKTWVQAAGRGSDEDWQRWNMFTLAIRGTEDVPADLGTVALPVAGKVQQGRPLEEIFLLRDEIANMVWGVEMQVPLPTGRSRAGRETGLELRSRLQQLVFAAHPPGDVEEAKSAAGVRYNLVNSVPENWIPFVPVHLDDSRREVQLQRASLPRILENDPDVPRKVEPRTSLLRVGLDEPVRLPYFLHEEEVSRAGAQVTRSFQRTRWHGGGVFTWLGIRKQRGRGEGRSGLAFDQVLPTKGAEPEA